MIIAVWITGNMQKAPRSHAAAAAAAALYFSTQPRAERDESRPCVSLPRWPNAALRPVSCDSADGDLKKKRAAVLKPLTLSHISLQTQLHFAKSLTNGGLTPALLTGFAGDQVGFIAVEFMSEWSRCMLISPPLPLRLGVFLSCRLAAAPSARPSLSPRVCNPFSDWYAFLCSSDARLLFIMDAKKKGKEKSAPKLWVHSDNCGFLRRLMRTAWMCRFDA